MKTNIFSKINNFFGFASGGGVYLVSSMGVDDWQAIAGVVIMLGTGIVSIATGVFNLMSKNRKNKIAEKAAEDRRLHLKRLDQINIERARKGEPPLPIYAEPEAE